MSPSSHGDHPLDLALAVASRGEESVELAAGSHLHPRGTVPPLVEWRSLDVRVHMPSCVPSSFGSQQQGPGHPLGGTSGGGTSGSGMAAVELLDPSDRACLNRLQQLLAKKRKVNGGGGGAQGGGDGGFRAR